MEDSSGNNNYFQEKWCVQYRYSWKGGSVRGIQERNRRSDAVIK